MIFSPWCFKPSFWIFRIPVFQFSRFQRIDLFLKRKVYLKRLNFLLINENEKKILIDLNETFFLKNKLLRVQTQTYEPSDHISFTIQKILSREPWNKEFFDWLSPFNFTWSFLLYSPQSITWIEANTLKRFSCWICEKMIKTN